jgi:pimeloyl-ACP methyl ester carboxylesterase
MKPQRFTIHVSERVLTDLRRRLANTRWPDEAPNSGWGMGTNLAYMKELADYWQNSYDWRKNETYLNTFKHFRADVDGVGIHFIHERGVGPNPMPIILTHGWPDSFYRYHKVIPMLTDPARYGGDPADAFDVIVPSLPGFGFSDRKAMAEGAVADLWLKLMNGLGYARFAAGGGDVGGIVTKHLAFKYSAAVTAIHLTDVGYPTGQEDFSTMTPAEMAFASFIQAWWMKEGGFSMVQMSKPQTLAFGLTDSPVGWAAWAMTLLGDPEEKWRNKDEQLTNLMIYWVTETIACSIRSYFESARAEGAMKPDDRVEVPSAVAHAMFDAPLPREWANRKVNLQHFSEIESGHFMAWEAPEAFVNDLRAFFRRFRRA